MPIEPEDWFYPSAESGRAARTRVNARLSESLSHIFEQCAEHIPVDRQASARLLEATSGDNRVAPAVFGAMFELLQQTGTGTLADVETALANLFAIDPLAAQGLVIKPYTPDGFTQAEREAFLSEFTSDSLLASQIGYLSIAAAPRALHRLERALDILRRHASLTYGEVHAVITEIIPAAGLPRNRMTFDGCSSLERWGAILMNMKRRKSVLEVAETIAHEAGHTALFGLSPRVFFVENDQEERYASPLRIDPRPIDGIYHATFVLARMNFAMRQVAEDPTAPGPMRAEARKLAARSAANFADGYRVLEAHAKYTPEGEAIMRDAHRYMAERAAA